jgi:hypothetical protein
MPTRTEAIAPIVSTHTQPAADRFLYFCEHCYQDAIDQLTLVGLVIPEGKKLPTRVVPPMITVDPVMAMAVRAAARKVIASRNGSPETARHPRHAGTIGAAVRAS